MKKLALMIAGSALFLMASCNSETNNDPKDPTVGQRVDTTIQNVKSTTETAVNTISDAADTTRNDIKNAAKDVKNDRESRIMRRCAKMRRWMDFGCSQEG